MSDEKLNITPEMVIEIIIRRRWFIMVPLCLSLIVGIFLVKFLPRIYEAKTLILVEGQRVPQNYVRSIVTDDTAERINTIAQQIMSRTNLEKIIQDFDLYPGQNPDKIFMEDKVANIRSKISVDVITDRSRQTDAFTITFRGTDPQKVMNVANGLAASFIDQNLRVRETQAIGTSEFLESELESMRMRLEKVETNIKDYRKTHMGELPEQLDTNLRILERLQENMTDRQQSLRDARRRLADLNVQASSRQPSVVVIGDNQRNINSGGTVEDLRAELERLRSRYTEKHPDIVRLKSRIAQMEADEKSNLAGSQANTQTRRIPADLRAQINDVQREIQGTESEIESLKGQIADYQKRVEDTPKREQELLGLRRDYQNIQASYDSLLNRKLEADIAVNMERKQKGEQFRIVDPARLPRRPVEPNMQRLFMMILAVGLGIGGGIAVLLEFFIDSSFRKADDIQSSFGLPVLATVPQLLQPKEIFLRKINGIGSMVFLFLVICLFAVFGMISLKGPGMLEKIIGS